MTPFEARRKENEEQVRTMLELNAVQKRKYPDVKVGDHVKVYTKKKLMDKEKKQICIRSDLLYGPPKGRGAFFLCFGNRACH